MSYSATNCSQRILLSNNIVAISSRTILWIPPGRSDVEGFAPCVCLLLGEQACSMFQAVIIIIVRSGAMNEQKGILRASRLPPRHFSDYVHVRT